MSYWKNVLIALLVLLIGVNCTNTKSTNPAKPKEAYDLTLMDVENEKYLSTLNIPLQIPVALLQKQLNEQLKGTIYEDESSDDLKIKIRKSGLIQVHAIDSTFLFDIPLDIWTQVGYDVSPLGFRIKGAKETRFAMRLKLVSTVAFTPGWRLVSHTRIDSYDWITEPKVTVKGIAIPVKMMVSRLLNKNQDEITNAIDSQVPNAIDVKSYVQQAWELANKPYLISEEYKTWLVVLPKKVMMTPLKVQKGILNAKIGIEAYTQTVTSSVQPKPAFNYKLPNLQITDNVTNDFKIGLTSQVTYADAAAIVKQNLAGEKFSFSNNKYTVEVVDIELYGQNEKLVIKASLKGSLNGIVYLKGVPYYNPEKNEVALKEVDFDLETRNVIYSSAAWLLKGKFGKMMEKQLVFPLTKYITETSEMLASSLKKNTIAPGIELDGKLGEIKPHKVYLTPEFICAVVFANGNVKLNISDLM